MYLLDDSTIHPQL